MSGSQRTAICGKPAPGSQGLTKGKGINLKKSDPATEVLPSGLLGGQETQLQACNLASRLRQPTQPWRGGQKELEFAFAPSSGLLCTPSQTPGKDTRWGGSLSPNRAEALLCLGPPLGHKLKHLHLLLWRRDLCLCHCDAFRTKP